MRKEREALQQLPYIHSFERYFEFEGQRIDRLKLILQYGVVSQKKAKELGIPFLGNTGKLLERFSEYASFVFVYSTTARNGLPIPGDTVLFFDNSIEVRDLFPNLSVGEMHVQDIIPREQIRQIRLPKGNGVGDVEEMVKEFIPEPRNIKVTTL